MQIMFEMLQIVGQVRTIAARQFGRVVVVCGDGEFAHVVAMVGGRLKEVIVAIDGSMVIVH